MKLKKRKKSSRIKNRTRGYSAKLHKGKGSRGGKGMSGSGKRGDQKKSLVINLYGKKYFGKQGITSKRSKKKKMKFMNVRELVGGGELDLQDYKILGEGEVNGKFIIKAKAASKSALDKIKKAGGEIILTGNVKKIKAKQTEAQATQKKPAKISEKEKKEEKQDKK